MDCDRQVKVISGFLDEQTHAQAATEKAPEARDQEELVARFRAGTTRGEVEGTRQESKELL